MNFHFIMLGEPLSGFTHRHKLAGTVTTDGTGGKRRVVVLDRGTLKYIASTVSGPDGTWLIQGIPERPEDSLIVLAFDDIAKVFNAEAADFISQVATV